MMRHPPRSTRRRTLAWPSLPIKYAHSKLYTPLKHPVHMASPGTILV